MQTRPTSGREWTALMTFTVFRSHNRDNCDSTNRLIALLQKFSKNRALFAAFFSLQMSEYFSETNTSMADLRMSVLQDDHSQLTAMLARGIERGEIDRSKLTPRIASPPADLLRREALDMQAETA